MNEFTETKFDESKIPDIPAELIDVAYEEGCRLIDSQYMAMKHVWGNSNTIIGWLIAVMAALTGVLVSNIVSGNVNLITILSSYGIIVILVAMVLLIIGVIFKKDFYQNGDSPSHFLRDGVLMALKQVEIGEYVKYAKGWALWEIQFKIMENTKRHNRMIKFYRIAMSILLCGVIVGALFIFFLIFLQL